MVGKKKGTPIGNGHNILVNATSNSDNKRKNVNNDRVHLKHIIMHNEK